MTAPINGPMIEHSRTVVLTPKGEAVRLAYRFLHALRELDDPDHHDVLEMLNLELSCEQQPAEEEVR